MRIQWEAHVDRRSAANILAEKLLLWDHCNGVVCAVSKGGVDIARIISNKLSLPMENLYCAAIIDPADPHRTVGSVCVREAVTHATQYDLPQDYLAHQVRMIQQKLKAEEAGLADDLSTTFKNKVVIVTDDTVENADELRATLEFIRKHEPLEIVVAVGTIHQGALDLITTFTDELFYAELITAYNQDRFESQLA